MEIDDALERLLQVKDRTEDRMVKAYAHAKFWAWAIGGIGTAVVAITAWVLTIEWRWQHIKDFMEPRQNIPSRVEKIEENDKRRDDKLIELDKRQRRLFKELFKVDPE